ncbi:MAG: sugar ABC transporter permease [Anaerolineaceae bacterium]
MSSPVLQAEPASPEVKTRFHLTRRLRQDLKGYLFVSPWLIGILVFLAYPTIASFYFSMTNYTILNPPKWIGLENLKVMLSKDPLYWKSVWNTVYYVIISVPLGLIVGLLLALLLNQQLKGIGFYRTAFYLPGLMPAVAGVLLWMVLLDPRLGFVNDALSSVGLPRLGWLQSSAWSKPGLILMSTWAGTGTTMLIFLAALKEVPQSLIEAAMIDGANAWQRFWNVTIPLISPTIFFNLIMAVIGSFQIFGSALIAGGNTSSSGPLDSLLMYMLLLYRNAFRYFNMGYASAMSLAMFIVLILITLLTIRSTRYWVYYEAVGRH